MSKVPYRINVAKAGATMGATIDFPRFLSLCKEADVLIENLCAKSPKLNGKKQNTLKAAALHYLARKNGLNITLNNLYLIYGCYQESIIRVKKALVAA
ncbi:hypothetical protein ES703_51645 [subsurface metagenome]